MPLIHQEPNVVIANLLDEEWNDDNITGEFKTPWISTGWWNEDSDNPQITLTNTDPNPSPNRLDASTGGLAAWVEGNLHLNVWSPAIRLSNGEGWRWGSNPKVLRWDLVREVHRILENNQDGTVDDQGNPVLSGLRTNQRIVFTVEQGDPLVYRARIPTWYQFDTRPEE